MRHGGERCSGKSLSCLGANLSDGPLNHQTARRAKIIYSIASLICLVIAPGITHQGLLKCYNLIKVSIDQVVLILTRHQNITFKNKSCDLVTRLYS